MPSYDKTKYAKLQVFVNKNTAEEIQKVSAEDKRPLSGYIRKLILEDLEKKKASIA
jgi:hypothetical protein